jgi:D-3-phosphoglycerate dehydrogenase
MKAYSIFDDFTREALDVLTAAGAEVTVHPLGVPRPDAARMKELLREYDCVIIGTSQKITEDMFDGIETPRVIATASVGLDHIRVPEEKRGLVTILNTPKANAQSVAEYTMACALACCKRLDEGRSLYRQGKDNKKLRQKPEDLLGKTMGVIGAGNISRRIMDYAAFFGMRLLCWTRNPDHHRDLEARGVRFVGLDELARTADFISVNLPNKPETVGLISAELVGSMKPNAVFISVSRLATIDAKALFEKARQDPGFYVCLDLDLDPELIRQIPDQPNVLVTPHIAGGTVETRKRMFAELAQALASMMEKS